MNIQPGDVLMRRDGAPDTKPYGRVRLNETWHPISLDPEGVFLILNVVSNSRDEVEVDAVALTCGTRIHFIFEAAALAEKLTVLRGERVVPA